MSEPAYIAIDDEGYVTLFWGDGTEAERTVIWRGPRAPQGAALVEIIEDLKAWAEDNGYVVIVPAYDLTVPDIEIDLPAADAENLDLGEVDDLLDDLYFAGDYDLPPDDSPERDGYQA